MSILLQNPALLALLALAGVPLLVHLIAKAKPPEYRFSNIAFLRKIITTSARLKKPKDYLILLLRTLTLAAFAAAFLLPLLVSENAALPGEKRTVILLIDRSASMAARDGTTSRFDAATALATQYLSSNKPDLANLIWIDSNPTPTFPEPAPNTDFLIDEINRAKPLPQPAAIIPAVELALRQLSDSQGHCEIHIISDFQKSAWENFSPTIPKNITLTLSKTAKEDLPNTAVTSLVPFPENPVAGQQIIIQTRVSNFSPEPRRVALTLDAGGSRQSQNIDLPANGEAEAAFSVRVPNPGLLPITAEIDADAFPDDNRRHGVIRVRESLRLAVSAPETDPSTQTLQRVASAIPWLTLIPAADPSNLPPCDILYLPAWSGDQPEKLLQISQKISLIVHPAPTCSAAAVAQLFDAPADPTSTQIQLQSNPAGWEASPASSHPIFQLFSSGQFGNPLAGSFRQRPKLSSYPSAEILGSFSDTTPALIRSKSRPILLTALSIDPAHSTWSSEAPFLPAIGEILLHLDPGTSNENFTNLPGASLAWTNPALDNSIPPTLESPEKSLSALVASGSTWKSETPATPGIHRWLISNQPVHLTAVNFPESESKLATLAETPQQDASTSSSSFANNPALARGLPLWPWLICAALLFILCEAVLASGNTPKPSLES